MVRATAERKGIRQQSQVLKEVKEAVAAAEEGLLRSQSRGGWERSL